ncbi:hypothetical protein MSAN_01910800 [Mycena sanguinolenta]|uniref:Uncharacterized protein n=1 Tax=Mycena sanguinolenta TaxID=230812 RepID=A0A8H7CPG8_9AGAR|nr:hypothetical protein MSAN_01910800 [Mycena sanguinolenta]
MKTGFTFVFVAGLLLTVSGTPVGSDTPKMVSHWAAERQAVALREARSAKAKVLAPAQREDIARLESQWAGRETRLALDDFLQSQQPLLYASRPQTGYISVHRGDSHGAFIGFLAANKIVETRDKAPIYTIAEPDRSITHIDVANSPFQLCVSAGPFGESIGPSMNAFHLSRHAPNGKSEAGPRWSPELNAFIMTSAFSLNRESTEITVHWVNPDGDSPRTMIAVAQHQVFYTGDLSAFEKVTGSGVELVAFNWIESRS